MGTKYFSLKVTLRLGGDTHTQSEVFYSSAGAYIWVRKDKCPSARQTLRFPVHAMVTRAE